MDDDVLSAANVSEEWLCLQVAGTAQENLKGIHAEQNLTKMLNDVSTGGTGSLFPAQK